ncbi:MAG: ABC transporter permease [Gammaproteobacteria bacterium]|nr:ABC transporter permease [Gammaproteobacteria bacterium]MYF02742.1 ABC transporter permease [Gammaproteobacteria bacterium]
MMGTIAPVIEQSSHFCRVLLAESYTEFLKCLRTPAFASAILGFPVIVYLFCGLVIDWGETIERSHQFWIIATSSIGAIGTGMFGFGVYVANERGQGWLLLKRVSPMPILVYFLAKALMAVAFSILICCIILAIGHTFVSLQLSLVQSALLVVVVSLSTIPYCMIGLLCGFMAGPNTAHAVVNVLYLPLLLLGGIIIPFDVLPKFVQSIALFTPVFHSSQLAFKLIDTSLGYPILLHLLVLSAYSVVCVSLAGFFYSREKARTFG